MAGRSQRLRFIHSMNFYGSGYEPALPAEKPVLDSIAPVLAGTGANLLNLYLYGSGFTEAMWGEIDGKRFEQDFATAGDIMGITLKAEDMAVAGLRNVYAVDGGVLSDPQVLDIKQSPVIASIDPVSCSFGATEFPITVVGGYFTPDGVVKVNGVVMPTTIVDAQTATAVIAASQLGIATPAKGMFMFCNGVGSNTVYFGILTGSEVAPTLVSYNPNPVPIGRTGNVTITGTGMDAACQVSMDGELLANNIDYRVWNATTIQLTAPRFWTAAGTHQLSMYHTTLLVDVPPLTITVA